jgi:hypothetical protein
MNLIRNYDFVDNSLYYLMLIVLFISVFNNTLQDFSSFNPRSIKMPQVDNCVSRFK